MARDNCIGTEAPGPGAYDAGSDFGGRSLTIGGRHDIRRSDQTPGPGAYRTSHTAGANAYSFGSGRGSAAANATPGPGSYSTDRRIGGGLSFGRAPRDGGRGDGVPGAGAYEPRTGGEIGRQAKNARMGMASRDRPISRSDGPGPGAYDQNGRLIADAGYSFSKDAAGDRPNGVPGPGAYHVDASARTLRAPRPGATRFGSATRDRPNPDNVPGPGAYESPDRRGQAYTMRGKHDPRLAQFVPGPGAYECDSLFPGA